MNLLKSLGSIWFYLAQHLGVFFVLLFFFVNIYSHPPYIVLSVRSNDPSLCTQQFHPSLLSLLLAPSPQQHKSFFHTSYKKKKKKNLFNPEISMAPELSHLPFQANNWKASSKGPIFFLPLLPSTLNTLTLTSLTSSSSTKGHQ